MKPSLTTASRSGSARRSASLPWPNKSVKFSCRSRIARSILPPRFGEDVPDCEPPEGDRRDQAEALISNGGWIEGAAADARKPTMEEIADGRTSRLDAEHRIRQKFTIGPSCRKACFAFPRQRKEPLTDASHVKNALARFDQVEGVSELRPRARLRQHQEGGAVLRRRCEENSWRELGRR